MSMADEIRKLDELRKQGLISDAEFERQKQVLLGGASPVPSAHAIADAPAWADIDLKNKWWFQWLLTLVIIPLGLLLVLFMKSYQRGKTGHAKRVSIGFKMLFVVLALVVWGVGIAGLVGGERPSASGVADGVAACDSDQARAVLANAIENNAASNVVTLRLLDVSDIEEVSVNAQRTARNCNATFVLNSGRERLGYTLSLASNGDLLVEVHPDEVEAPAAQQQPANAETSSPAPSANENATAPNGQNSNVDYDLVRQQNLTADQIAIVERVCGVPYAQRVDQLSIAELSYDRFCKDSAAPQR